MAIDGISGSAAPSRSGLGEANIIPSGHESTIPSKAPLPSFEFSTEGIEHADQFAVWRDSLASMVELSEVRPKATVFSARQKVWDLGCLVLGEFSTDEVAFESLSGHIRKDPVDHWTITLLRTGSNRTKVGEREFSGEVGDVQIHSLGRRFAGDITKSDLLMLFVPRDFSSDTACILDAAEFSIIQNGMGRLFADYMINIANRLPTLTSADCTALVAATRAMIAACIAPSQDRLDAAAGPIATVLLDRARKLIQTRLFDPSLNSELLRRELGISRTRLYNLFEPFGGVMHYIQHRRLLDAHAALTNVDDRRLIFQIAEERGFNDGADFSRSFKRAFGYSPSEVRRRRRIDVPLQAQLHHSPPEQRLNELLRHLKG